MVISSHNKSLSIHSLDDNATQSMMDSDRVGLDYIVENADYMQKLASALESKNFVLKKQVFELLSALCVYSSDGYGRSLQVLEYFKNHTGARYRFKFVITELRDGPNVEYQTAVLALINCLILATPDVPERIRIRSEFIGLRLLQELSDLRHKCKESPDLVVQLDVFEESKESDESQSSPTSSGIDLSSPLEVYDAILRQISDTPQEVPFLSILQHLLRIDPKEPISDMIWDSAERLVHRATLLESRDDALRLLKAPSHSKSMHKLKGSSGGDRCTCVCHKSDRKGSLSLNLVDMPNINSPANLCSPTNGNGNGPPPPPPPMGGPPPPPPPAPNMPSPPPPPPTFDINSQKTKDGKPLHGDGRGGREKELPKLPQQSIPMPKSKMRTVNWNKIPSNQILSGDQQNMWATFGRSQSSRRLSLDWAALEGLFCLQSDKGNMINNNSNSMNTTQSSSSVSQSKNGEVERRNLKKETSEVILLDAKRSLNINIFLKQFRSSNEEMLQLILEGSSEDFGAERLRGLLKILPTKDEIEILKLVSAADKNRLGSAEKFLLQLIQVNGYRLRVEAMLLKEELEACVNSLESSINAILHASQDVKESIEFQEVIFMILVAGNFLNSGGYAGDAAGVKLSSLQKVADIRGNKPGISLLHFVAMQAEARNPKLISFVNDMMALEEASKTSIDQLKSEILSLKTKVTNIRQQMENPSAPKEIISQFGLFFQEASLQISALEHFLTQVEEVRVDLARFFCEEIQTFKFEDCFKILHSFTSKWKQAATENARRKKQEEEAETRRKIREEQLKKRVQLGWQNQQDRQAAEEAALNMDRNKASLSPEDEIFIACSPRIVRRRLGSFSDNPNNGHSSNDQLALPSPDTTPNGSLRRRRSRVPSDEDETGLMDYLRTSGGDGSRERERERRPGNDQYGSLDRSWSRKTRRRPNLMDFVNDERERPVSPAPAHAELKGNPGNPTVHVEGASTEGKSENPTREWRERIAAWFVDLENGNGEGQKRRPPPRRFQRRLATEVRGDSGSRGLATLPEGEIGQEEGTNATTYQRVYPDRKPSLKLTTDIVGTMQAIEEVQSPLKEKSVWRRPSLTASITDLMKDQDKENTAKAALSSSGEGIKEDSRRSLIGSLGNQSHDERLVLYIPEESLPNSNPPPRRMSAGKIERSNSDNRENHSSIVTVNGGQANGNGGGSTEGFDRFASIRRSRRYKKGPEVPPINTNVKRDSSAPSTPSPQPKFVSKIDISGQDAPSGEPKSIHDTPPIRSSKTPLTRIRQRNDTRSASMIEPRHVHLALGRNPPPSKTPNDTNSHDNSSPASNNNNNNNVTGITTGPTTRSPINVPSSVRDPAQHSFHSSKNLLSSSPGSAEHDEGFEESQSSLSETNSQSESNNNFVSSAQKTSSNNSHSNSSSNNHNNNNNNKTRTSNNSTNFRTPVVATENGSNSLFSRHSSSSASKNTSSSQPVVVQAVRKKSRQENNPAENNVSVLLVNNNNNINNNNKNSSRTSLLSSRSSLASQTTVNTVREVSDTNKPREKVNVSPRSSDGSVSVLPTIIGNGTKKPLVSSPLNSSSMNARNVLTSKNARSDTYNTPPPPTNGFFAQSSNDKEKNNMSGNNNHSSSNGLQSKNFGPRILSFMRPTASSSAKDKLDPPKIKGSGKKTFK